MVCTNHTHDPVPSNAAEGVAGRLEKRWMFALSFVKLPWDGVSLVFYGTKFKWLILLYKWYTCFNVSIIRILV